MSIAFEGAVDTLFRCLGVEGVYEGEAIKVILLSPGRVVDWQEATFHSPSHTLQVRLSEIPSPKAGESISVGEDSYTIQGEPKCDQHDIMVGLEDGHVIRGKERRMLAIPTRNAPKRIWGKRVTPALYEQAKGPLTFITYRGKGLLVDTNLQAPYSRETGAFRKLRRIRKGASNPTNVRPKVMFWLVPQVRMPKKIDFKKDSKRWHSRIPALVVKNWEILE